MEKREGENAEAAAASFALGPGSSCNCCGKQRSELDHQLLELQCFSKLHGGNGYPVFLLDTLNKYLSAQEYHLVCLKGFPSLKFMFFVPKVVVPKIPASLTCRARPFVSMGRVNAETAHRTQTDEKRHRAPSSEVLIRTCKSEEDLIYCTLGTSKLILTSKGKEGLTSEA